MKTLLSMSSAEDETFGHYEISEYEKGLEKAVEDMAKHGEGGLTRESGTELTTLM